MSDHSSHDTASVGHCCEYYFQHGGGEHQEGCVGVTWSVEDRQVIQAVPLEASHCQVDVDQVVG